MEPSPPTAPTGTRAVARTGLRARAAGIAFTCYGLLALLAYRPVYPGNSTRLPTCACGDLVQGLWFLRWTPFALLHAHNLFLTNYLDYPGGVNLAQNVSMPLLGVLAAPVTLTLGPIASVNFMLWLAFPVSATAAFVVLRRWVRWTPAAFVGGLLYGFSPYMVGQGAGHLNLVFVPFPPLILAALDQLLIRQSRSAKKVGIALGLLAAAQFLISPEIFLSTVLLAAIGTAVLAIAHRDQVRDRLGHVAVGLAIALVLCGAVIAYPSYLTLLGPGHYVGSAHGAYPFAADLLGPVVPTGFEWVAPASWTAVGNRFILGDVVENGSYLGIPLLVLVVALTWRMRRSGVVRFAALMAIVAGILSLGPRLTVKGHVTAVRLPFALLDHLPVFPSFADARFSLYVDLFVAVVLAVGLDRLRAGWSSASSTALERTGAMAPAGAHRRVARRPSTLGVLALVAIVVVALVPLIPKWPYPSYRASTPSFFTSTDVDRVPPGGVVLTYPYPDNPNVDAMIWQAESGMHFRLIGGYALVAGADRVASYNAIPGYQPSVPATLVADFLGTTPSSVHPGAERATPGQVRAFLSHYGVGTVLAQPSGAHPGAAYALLRAALGTGPQRRGGVDAWFGVQRDLRRTTTSSNST